MIITFFKQLLRGSDYQSQYLKVVYEKNKLNFFWGYVYLALLVKISSRELSTNHRL